MDFSKQVVVQESPQTTDVHETSRTRSIPDPDALSWLINIIVCGGRTCNLPIVSVYFCFDRFLLPLLVQIGDAAEQSAIIGGARF